MRYYQKHARKLDQAKIKTRNISTRAQRVFFVYNYQENIKRKRYRLIDIDKL